MGKYNSKTNYKNLSNFDLTLQIHVDNEYNNFNKQEKKTTSYTNFRRVLGFPGNKSTIQKQQIGRPSSLKQKIPVKTCPIEFIVKIYHTMSKQNLVLCKCQIKKRSRSNNAGFVTLVNEMLNVIGILGIVYLCIQLIDI